MKLRITLTLLSALLLAACTPKNPVVDKDTIVTSQVNGVTLHHRAAIQAPHQFTPINEEYRSLYSVSIMDKPGYGGDIVNTLENGAGFYALGRVESDWLAVSAVRDGALIGYIIGNAGVEAGKYRATVLKDRRVRRAPAKKTTKATTTKPAAAQAQSQCVSVGGGEACKNTNSSTWILD